MMNKMWRSEFVQNAECIHMSSLSTPLTHIACVTNAVLTMDLMRMTFLTTYSGWILSTLMERGEGKGREGGRERELS